MSATLIIKPCTRFTLLNFANPPWPYLRSCHIVLILIHQVFLELRTLSPSLSYKTFIPVWNGKSVQCLTFSSSLMDMGHVTCPIFEMRRERREWHLHIVKEMSYQIMKTNILPLIFAQQFNRSPNGETRWTSFKASNHSEYHKGTCYMLSEAKLTIDGTEFHVTRWEYNTVNTRCYAHGKLDGMFGIEEELYLVGSTRSQLQSSCLLIVDVPSENRRP